MMADKIRGEKVKDNPDGTIQVRTASGALIDTSPENYGGSDGSAGAQASALDVSPSPSPSPSPSDISDKDRAQYKLGNNMNAGTDEQVRAWKKAQEEKKKAKKP